MAEAGAHVAHERLAHPALATLRPFFCASHARLARDTATHTVAANAVITTLATAKYASDISLAFRFVDDVTRGVTPRDYPDFDGQT